MVRLIWSILALVVVEASRVKTLTSVFRCFLNCRMETTREAATAAAGFEGMENVRTADNGGKGSGVAAFNVPLPCQVVERSRRSLYLPPWSSPCWKSVSFQCDISSETSLVAEQS